MARPDRKLGLAFVSVVAVFATAVAVAWAAPGDLIFADCVANGGANGCVDPPIDALETPSNVAVSPDGNDVYTSPLTAVGHLSRAADGSLAFADCVANRGFYGCAAPTMDSLNDPAAFAFGPGGIDVYVAADGVTQLHRAADGSLSFGSCVANGGLAGCTDPPLDSLDGAFDIAIAPGDKDLYVAALFPGSVTHLSRNPDGTLKYEGCVANGGAAGCDNPAHDSLERASGVDVSPDGADVYVASRAGNSITHFSRDGFGFLTFEDCIADGGANGCADPPHDSLGGANRVAVSPDGADVYVTGLSANSVSHLRRAADGSLTFADCVANEGANGCADPAHDALQSAGGLSLTPDGADVYVAATGGDSVSRLSRAADGSLVFESCVADAGANGCADPASDSLDGATGVAVSGDGAEVYVSSQNANSVTHFTRDLTSPPPPPPPPLPKCKGKTATIVALPGVPTTGTGRRDVIVGTAGADVIRARAGNDLVCGRRGRDTIYGARGRDSLYGEGGRDTLNGGAAKDRFYGGAGGDRLIGGRGGDWLFGQAGADKIYGQGGSDALNGGPGRPDICNGGAGTDRRRSPGCELRRLIP